MTKHCFFQRQAREAFTWNGKRTGEGEPEIVYWQHPWNDSGENDEGYSFNGQPVKLGDRFIRKAEIRKDPVGDEEEGELIKQAGPWEWFRPQGEPRDNQRLVLANIDRKAKSNPGQNMKDPEGQPIWVEGDDGKPERPKQPDENEPQRDAWSGEVKEAEEPEPEGGGVSIDASLGV